MGNGDPRSSGHAGPAFAARLPDLALYGAVALVSLLIYGQTVGFPLIWDSASLITENPATRTFDPLTAFTAPTTIGGAGAAGDRVGQLYYYRPVLQVLISGWYQLAGANSALWHGLAVTLNIVACLLVFRLMRAMEQPRWAAFAVALLFAVNPGRVAGITSVYGLSNQFFGVFALAAFLCWVREARGWTLGFLALALGCRETAVLFPAIALFWALLFKKDRRAWGWLGAQVALVAAYLAARALVVETPGLTTVAPLTWANTVAVIVSNHLHSLAWPGWGAREYPMADYSDFSLQFVLSYAVLAGGVIALVWGAKRNRWVAFWLLWFGTWLSIHFNVGRFGDFLMAEKDNYLLALSFAVLFVAAARMARQYAPILCAAVVVAQGGLSAWRASYWHDPVTFFSSAIEHAPGFAPLYYNLGLALVDDQDFSAAAAAFRKTVQLVPNHSMAWNNLGNIRYMNRDLAGATRAWRNAYDADPGNMMAAYNLSLAYSRLGDRQTAAQYYARYLTLKAGKEAQAPPR